MPKQDDVLSKYADMLDLPHHISMTRPRMCAHDRAAQFAPFAALAGHDAAIRETARIRDKQAELDGDRIELLHRKIRKLMECKNDAPEVCIKHFVHDPRKAGGSYVTKTSRFKDCDLFRHVVIMEDLTEIPVSKIYDITSKVLDDAELN